MAGGEAASREEDCPEEFGGGFGEPPTPAEIRENLRRQPKPNRPQVYDLSGGILHRHVPRGSVLVFRDPASPEEDHATLAVLVTGTESRPSGVWVSVKVVGLNREESRNNAQARGECTFVTRVRLENATCKR